MKNFLTYKDLISYYKKLTLGMVFIQFAILDYNLNYIFKEAENNPGNFKEAGNKL